MSNNENNIVYIYNNSPPNIVIAQPQITSNNIDIEVIQNFHYISPQTFSTNNIDVNINHHNISVDVIDNRLAYNVYNNFQGIAIRYVKSIYNTYSIEDNDDIVLAYPTAQNINIILPSATTHINKTLTFKRKSGGYNVEIIPMIGQTIDDENLHILQFKNESITIISDNNNWCII